MFGSPEFLANPYAEYAKLRAKSPVTWVPGMMGPGAWLVTSHELCTAVLRDRAFGIEGYRVLSPEQLAKIPTEAGDVTEERRANMTNRDPPAHTRMRGLITKAFTARAIERMRPHVNEIADHLVDAVQSARRINLIRDFAYPLPIIVIAGMLGVPSEDRDRFKVWSAERVLRLNPSATPEEMERSVKAADALDAYLTTIIEERRREPKPDLITELVRVEEQGDKLNSLELLANIRFMLIAGHDTTSNLIGNGVLTLLRHPEQRAALAADPSLLPNAVEEILRYESPVQLTRRFAMEDTSLGDQQLKRGDLVVPLFGAANRDPAVFPDPDRFDMRRHNASEHLTMGGGIHYCLGASLAKLEGQIAIGLLLKRMPEMALATDTPRWRKHPVLRGVEELPVTF